MLNILVGRPGGGKSYEAVVFHIIPAIKSGRKVITNLPLNVDAFVDVFGHESRDLIEIRQDKMTEEGMLYALSTKECFTSDTWRDENGKAALYVIDECHFQFPNQGRTKTKNENLLDCMEHFSMHRHHGQDFLFITQALKKIHRDLKDMIQTQYRVSKNVALGSDKSYTKKVFDGAVGSNSSAINTEIRKYKPQYFKFYKSHTQSSGDVKEANASDVKPVWKHWSFILAVFLLVCVAVNVYVNGFSLFGTEAQAEEVESVATTTASPVQADTPQYTNNSPVNSNSYGSQIDFEADDMPHPYQGLGIHVSGYSDVLTVNERRRLS